MGKYDKPSEQQNMVCQTAKNAQTALPATKQFNVTDLTPSQRRELFSYCLTQAGFTGFVKKEMGEQTHYTFTYRSAKGDCQERYFEGRGSNMPRKKGKVAGKKHPSILDLIGSAAGKVSVEEVKRMLDEMRAEDED